MSRGKFIVLERSEGLDTAVVASHLAHVFDALLTQPDEKAVTPVWEVLRGLVEHTIRPTLQRGRHVIADQFDARAYVNCAVEGEKGPEFLRSFSQERLQALGDCIPDLYIWLDLSPNSDDDEAPPIRPDVRLGLRAFFLNYATENCSIRIINVGYSLSEVLGHAEALIRECIEEKVPAPPCP